MNRYHDLPLRATRDRLINLLFNAEFEPTERTPPAIPFPMRDLPLAYQPVVPFGSRTAIYILGGQEGISYFLCDEAGTPIRWSADREGDGIGHDRVGYDFRVGAGGVGQGIGHARIGATFRVGAGRMGQGIGHDRIGSTFRVGTGGMGQGIGHDRIGSTFRVGAGGMDKGIGHDRIGSTFRVGTGGMGQEIGNDRIGSTFRVGTGGIGQGIGHDRIGSTFRLGTGVTGRGVDYDRVEYDFRVGPGYIGRGIGQTKIEIDFIVGEIILEEADVRKPLVGTLIRLDGTEDQKLVQAALTDLATSTLHPATADQSLNLLDTDQVIAYQRLTKIITPPIKEDVTYRVLASNSVQLQSELDTSRLEAYLHTAIHIHVEHQE